MADCFAMIRRGLVKTVAVVSALGACATPRPPAGTAAPVTVAAREVDAPPPAPPAAETPALTGLTADELAALRPLLTRGPASVVRNPDGGRDARITLLTRTDATPETVRRVITTPGDYGTFMPILRGVDVLSQHGNRTGFRFHVAAPLFDVTALCAMRDLGERRVDVAITQSETGPGGSRWDLSPTATAHRGVAHHLGRPLAGPLAPAPGGAPLALGHRGDEHLRRHRARAGRRAPRGDPRWAQPPRAARGGRRGRRERSRRPPRGPWLALTRDATVLSMAAHPRGVGHAGDRRGVDTGRPRRGDRPACADVPSTPRCGARCAR
jgi:hypothetical protein